MVATTIHESIVKFIEQKFNEIAFEIYELNHKNESLYSHPLISEYINDCYAHFEELGMRHNQWVVLFKSKLSFTTVLGDKIEFYERKNDGPLGINSNGKRIW